MEKNYFTSVSSLSLAIFALLTIFPPVVSATSADAMNGYKAAEFGDFANNWKLVTVRFRKDTGEMRWTYANDLAWRALTKPGSKFPDGAIFAKIGMMTKEDPAFPSSATPSGARRLQFMVKDQKKHSDTDGWGYSIFNADGSPFPGDQKQAVMACAACHKLVPQRDYVFSQPMGISLPDESWRKHLGFERKSVRGLPEEVRLHLPKGTKNIRWLTGALVGSVFPGTLDEIVPLLARETATSGEPTLLFSPANKQFSLVVPQLGRDDCPSGQMPMKNVHSMPDPKTPLYEKVFCGEVP